ncbi:MAG: allantoinase AllB [Verrucomicrobiota bacterium]
MVEAIVRDIKLLEMGLWQESDLVIEGGKIVGREAVGLSAKTEIDGAGAYCFSGAVDLHVHFNEPGRTDWEGFETGSSSAAAGGVTYVADMPLNNLPSTVNVAALEEKLAAVSKKTYVDFGLWGGVVPGNAEHLVPLAEAGVMGFKAFMSPSGNNAFDNSDQQTLRDAMQRIAPTGLRLALHAEDPDVLDAAAAALPSRESAVDWLASRPVQSEISAVSMAIELSIETGCPITIVHVSAPEVLEVIHDAQEKGVDLVCETCPHYLLLSSEEAESVGPNAKCAPPLRPPATVEAMLDMLVSHGIDTIGSDHSPSSPDLKDGKSFYDAWGGISGIQHGLPFLIDLFSLGDSERLQSLQDAFATTPADLIGLANKGRLSLGSDADFFLVEALDTQHAVKSAELLYRHPISVYLGFDLELAIRQTWLRGSPVIVDGRVVGLPRGRFIAGQAFKK